MSGEAKTDATTTVEDMPTAGMTEDQISESLQKAIETGRYRSTDMRPQIKLPPAAPKIAVCIPMGDKDDPDLFVCENEDCKHRHFGVVKCGKCGTEHSARKKLRHAGLIPIEWWMSAQQIVPPLLSSMSIMVRKSVLSAQARDEMTKEAIRLGCKYIFYWDDDTIIPPKAIYDLHNMMERNPDAGIISGVYFTRENCPEPLIYKRHGQGAYWGFDPFTYGNLDPIFGAGAGCMMARVDALKEVDRNLADGEPFWKDEFDMELFESTGHRAMWGHDIRFCRRMWESWQITTPVEATAINEDGSDILDEQGEPAKITLEEVGPLGVRDVNKEVSEEWKVYAAGWIMCHHFDIPRQTMFGTPQLQDWLRKKKDNQNNTPAYWDHVWKAEGHDTWRTYPPLYDRIVELVPRHSKVVDVGCGIGVLLDRLAKQKQCDTYGYDIAPEAIKMMKSRWIEGEAMDLIDFELNHFDQDDSVVVSTETMEHLDDERLEKVLSEAAKAKMAILSTPQGHLEGTPHGEHVQEWTKEEYEALLKKHFSKVSVEVIAPHYLLGVCTNEHT